MISLSTVARAALLAALSTVLWSCVGAAPHEARVDLVERSVPTSVAIAPMAGVPLDNAGRIWTMIADAAAKSGFRVVGDQQAVGYFLELQNRLRGVPRNGATALGLRSKLHALLARDHGANGVMYVEFAKRRARVRNGVAMWDGATERILAVDHDPHDNARGYSGEVAAWSLRLWIEDARAAVVAEGFGGVSLDAHMHAGRWESDGSGPKLHAPDVLPAAIRAAASELGRAL